MEGIIRGDVPWPTTIPYNEKDLRRITGLSIWGDYENLPNLSKLGLPGQKIPEDFIKKDNETLETLRNRLYQCIRIPLVLSALNDLKVPYTEIMNPFLSKEIVEVTRTLPNNLLKDKQLFKDIVNKYSPSIGYAQYSNNGDQSHILEEESMKKLLIQEMVEKGDSIFTEEYMTFLMENIDRNHELIWKKYMKKAKTKLSHMFQKV
ncbi:hypothetical protein [Thalassobacillus sp. C254]|uniref:hypothetical protein n=1 Tax=Thalassobacillus sp. C254 TaxID=1225341 RepID=UPI0006D04A04|nr:hypothetical protein [Thalassobacillus sp. C254]